MSRLDEGLQFKEMVGLIKPTIYVDEFKSKVGSDDAYIVLSFYVHNMVVAQDLVAWFESGYPFVVDADRSPGEIEPNRYLVFVEVKRRTQVIEWMREMCEDLETLTEFNLSDWTITYNDEDFTFDDEDRLREELILSPKHYREVHEEELNEMRMAANIPTKKIYDNDKDPDMNLIRQRAGLL